MSDQDNIEEARRQLREKVLRDGPNMTWRRIGFLEGTGQFGRAQNLRAALDSAFPNEGHGAPQAGEPE